MMIVVALGGIASGGNAVVFRNMNDGGVLLLQADGGPLLGADGGALIIPIASASRCALDAGMLIDALGRHHCRRSKECLVRDLDLQHEAIPPCMAATAEAWRSDAVRAAVNVLGRECGFETRYPRDSCPQAVCRSSQCILGE